MLTFTTTVRNKADKLAAELDKVISNSSINTRKATWLLRYANVINYANVNGLKLVEFNTRAETIRKWIATGHVFFEGNKAISLEEIGMDFNTGRR
ncbi:hypothetical protein PQB86_gp061 [Klebsiella phage Miami]|jgi:hypothetical protein|uniref:Uncharacterized protein n=1 Tax=Klebsiella phage Miami TaxID=2767581 RepID=A0A873WI61_9CAUD|nr:hypothetical protein PQB86_gp061 [Klebsiella phage Miami]QPB09156.1 hypothetical protein CPT_Miami_061 [Klebsiella phage Miami]WNY40907.1 hypothetical protein [Klebsiella phage YC1]